MAYLGPEIFGPGVVSVPEGATRTRREGMNMDVEELLRRDAERFRDEANKVDLDAFRDQVFTLLDLDAETVAGFEPANNRFAGGPLGPLGNTVTD